MKKEEGIEIGNEGITIGDEGGIAIPKEMKEESQMKKDEGRRNRNRR